MALPNLNAAQEVPLLSTESSQEVPKPASGLREILVGRSGLRTGWRLLIFVVLVFVLLGGFLLIRNGGLQGFQEAQKHAAEVTVTPLLMIWSEGMALLLLCVATLIMGKIEHRKFSEYGLPLRQALGKHFWIGAGSGFLAISGTLLIMFLLHGFRMIALLVVGLIFSHYFRENRYSKDISPSPPLTIL